MFQFLVSFTVPPDHHGATAHAEGPHFGAFFAEAAAYAEGPTWLMRGTVVGVPA
ncbi:hypothetical protein SAMN05421837_106393 [Amycolatopsis pretoriensis]|uniref:Uncharacterized protein n=1 Tax=Amycolatopsis pretoriensis TaxID=218821 RepID=A0A1H5R2Z1_9PSEU|nr:hypothetical protein SAMN05421837_106393 [Amycolatopsis pretoriensis]